MGWTNEIKAEFLTRSVMAGGNVLARLNDKALLKFMRSIRPMIRDKAMREGFDELIDAFAMGPPNTTLVRRMVRESKYEELRDFMFGAFCFKEMDLEDM
jgi:hypothetical protein